jgi:hypothetical protein
MSYALWQVVKSVTATTIWDGDRGSSRAFSGVLCGVKAEHEKGAVQNVLLLFLTQAFARNVP